MTQMTTSDASFRDPAGFIFFDNGRIYRYVDRLYRSHYDALIQSGLYKNLVERKLLVAHKSVEADDAVLSKTEYSTAYKILEPEIVPFISYPFEWAFSQLKDAALLCLEVQEAAINRDMSLKDCTAYNVQFLSGRPIFIDTLSFEKLNPSQPWVAYKQFCEHFLAPLVLMRYADNRLNRLLQLYLDGIPLDLAVCMLPKRTFLKMHLLIHLLFHARSQQKYAKNSNASDMQKRTVKQTKMSMLALIDSLKAAVYSIPNRRKNSHWSDYYKSEHNYNIAAFEHKKRVVTEFLDEVSPITVWDLGANTGLFTRLATRRKINTISIDSDIESVEENYRVATIENDNYLLPLCIDLTNPTPAIGWQNKERLSLLERGPTDLVMALALVHHLAISNNLPFSKISNFFQSICNHLIIEFIDKSDSQVQRLLRSRDDIFFNYNQSHFEAEFSKDFLIKKVCPVHGSSRTLYLMKKR